MRIVAKFGGTSLGDGDRLNKAAESIQHALDDDHEVAVVVSAMGNTTDKLLEEIQFNAVESDKDEIVSMGERISARMVKAALNSRNIESEFYEPGSNEWPIIMKSNGEVDEKATRKRASILESKLGTEVPVITGFLAEDHEGNITTLGRGGSDTTAIMLGKFLNADRTVIVTDVEGVLTGNPNIVEATHNLEEISIDELRDLSFKGAEVVSPEALPYKDSEMDVHVVHFQNKNLLESGTSIEGEFERITKTDNKKYCCLTVAGRQIRLEPGILACLSNQLCDRDININAVSTGIDSICFFVNQKNLEEANRALHNTVVNKENISGVTVDRNIGMVRIAGGKLPDRPGVVNEIVEPLAEANINIHEIVSSAASVTVFVSYDLREKSLRLIQQNIGE